ncbi:MAG: hypothetical protein ACC618_03630 [Patescibacteria group bacterium]
MSIVERAGSFFLKRRLDRQIERIERLEEKAEERGMTPLGQIDFNSAKQEQWDKTALRVLEGATNEELDKMFEVLPLSLLTSIVKDWKHNLQKYRNSLG